MIEPRLQGADESGEDLAPAALLRAGADGELNPAQQRALAAHLLMHPEDEPRVEFERRLRDACGRAMRIDGVPPDLRDRIAAAVCAAGASDDVPQDEPARPTAGPNQRGQRKMASSFLSPGRIALYAAVLIGVAGAGIYYMQQSSPTALIGEATTPSQVATFVKREHDALAGSEAAATSKLTVTDLAAVPDACRGWVGRELNVDQVLAAGLAFVGAGESAVPGPGRSAHLLFRTADGGQPVSLFVQVYRPDGTELPVEENVVYTLATPGGATPIVVWRQRGLVYHLLAESEQTSAAVRTAMGVAEPSRRL